MTLITIIQDALAECGQSEIPSTIINNTSSNNAMKCLAIMKGLGKDLCRQYKWPELRDTYTFSTVANVSGYNLPTDFQRMVPLTQWDRTSRFPLNGPATDSLWESIQSGVTVIGLRMWYRFKGGQMQIGPTPTDVRTIAFDYFKNTWVSSATGTPQVTFLADTDYPIFLPNNNAEDLMRLGLIYKFKASSGLAYADDKGNFLSAIDADVMDSNDMPLMDFTGSGRYVMGRGNLPETGFGS